MQRYREFGCEGQGGRILAVPLSVMIQRYASGQLTQLAH
jgi:hypothetical protein